MAPPNVINGTKPCNCPLHNGERIPVSRFRKRKRIGKSPYYESRCKASQSLRNTGLVRRHRKTDLRRSGYIPLERGVILVFEEIVSRVGKVEGAREIGIARANLKKILTRQRKQITAETLARAIVVRDQLRKNNVVLHKNDIRRGKLARGEKVSRPKSSSDYYNQHDDIDVEARRMRREGKYMIKGNYLCGCSPDDPKLKNYTTTVQVEDGQEVLTSKRYDRQGFEICPIHGHRLYGWNSIQILGPQGNNIIDYHSEYENLYGKTPSVELKTDTPDLRDNRDPEEVGLAFLAERAAERNGKTESYPAILTED